MYEVVKVVFARYSFFVALSTVFAVCDARQ